MKYVNFTRSLLLTITLFGLTAASASAADRLYRWIDDNGNQVNSDRPPAAGMDYEVISTESSMVRTLGDKSDSPDQVEGDNGEPDAGETERASDGRDSDSDSKKNPENCAIARNNLTQLNSSARIRLKGDDGEIRYLNEEEKDIQRENATRAIDFYCP